MPRAVSASSSLNWNIEPIMWSEIASVSEVTLSPSFSMLSTRSAIFEENCESRNSA